MKELYNKYFHVPESGKISEKVMLTRVVTTVVLVIFCLIAMSISAYAYFSYNLVSDNNVIRTAEFNATIVVTDVTVVADPAGETPIDDSGNYLLKKGNKYTVSIAKGGNATTGFCIVEIVIGDSTVKYHTAQLGADGDNERLNLNFTFDLSELTDSDTVTVKFTPHWGTSSNYGSNENIMADANVKISDEGNIEISLKNEETSEAPSEESNNAPSDTSGDENSTETPENGNQENTPETENGELTE